jgi:hypothetical protein
VCPTCYYPFPTLHGNDCESDRPIGGAGPEFSLPEFTLVRSAHKNTLLNLFQSLVSRDFITFEVKKSELNKVLLSLLSIYRGVKVRIFLEVLMEKGEPSKKLVVPQHYFLHLRRRN